MNVADSMHLASALEKRGYRSTQDPSSAGIAVLNTCVVRQQAEDKIYGRLGSLKRIKAENPSLTIALMGCMVGVKEAAGLSRRYPFVDVFMPPSDPQALLEYLDARDHIDSERRQQDRIQDANILLPIEKRGTIVTAFVPIVLGCSHACSFCIIPYRRGGERSRPKAEIISEIESLVEQGIREVTLLGQIVDRYGLDLADPLDLADLLRAIHPIAGLERIRFLTSHPNWMTDKLLDSIAELDKICPQLDLPIQSGNDKVLEDMRRGYSVTEYHRLIGRIRARLPKIAIHTDIIVGFPGESESEFMDTYSLLEQIRFDKVHCSKYSARPRTVATRFMKDDISENEKARRWRLLDQLQQRILSEKNQAYQDEVVHVLVESKLKGRWRGRSPENKLVFFEDPRTQLIGRTLPIRIGWTGPYSLIGEAIDRSPCVGHKTIHEPLAC